MTVESRLVNYASKEDIADLDEHDVYRFFEFSEHPDDGCLQSTFPNSLTLEYRIGEITIDVSDEVGITCNETLTTAINHMLSMRENIDRLAVYHCKGYCKGKPPPDPRNKPGHTGAVVRALKPVECLGSYNYWTLKRKGGKPNVS